MENNIFTQSLSGIEAYNAILSQKEIPEIIKISFLGPNPPLWNIFEHFTFKYMGSSEVIIRSLSLSFFLVAIFFTYKTASLLFSTKTAVIATFLTILNPLFFSLAFEGQAYSLVAAGLAGSMFFFTRSFFGEGGKWIRLGYIITTLIALYSHHFAAFAILLQIIWWLYEIVFNRRESAKRILKSMLIIVILYCPWFYALYVQSNTNTLAANSATLDDPINSVFTLLSEGIKEQSLKLPILNENLHRAALYMVFATLLSRKWWKSIKKTLFLLLWFSVPVLANWALSQKFNLTFSENYLLFVIPASMIIASSARTKFSLVPISLLAITFVAIDFHFFTHPSKPPFIEVASYVSENKKDIEILVSWPSNQNHYLWETKYYKISSPIYSTKEKNRSLPPWEKELMDENDILEKIPESVEKIGVIANGPEEVKIEGFEHTETKTFNNLKIIWLTKKQKP